MEFISPLCESQLFSLLKMLTSRSSGHLEPVSPLRGHSPLGFLLYPEIREYIVPRQVYQYICHGQTFPPE